MYNNTVSLLLSDTYKQCHDRMYPSNLTKLVSYWTPRKAMIEGLDKMVFFGLQAFIKEFLLDSFDHNFFWRPIDDVMDEYTHYMNGQIGQQNYDVEKVVALHQLGYLPLQIRALPEGTLVNMGVPCIEITNTNEDFAWLVQWVECILQTELWSICTYASIGKQYHDLAKEFYDETVCGVAPEMAMADFGMRGMSCLNDSIRTSAAWLLSFDKTSTIPALKWLDEMYHADCVKNHIGIGAVSTEHSVMGANYALDGDEITFVKRLLTELYPNTSFSMVSDTYDYWNMIHNILPACRKEIMEHNGKLLVRPDSGDFVEIAYRTIVHLWDTFGGTVNEKGYKVLDPHIGLIYGDGCSLNRVREVLIKLKENGYAANNIGFGVGAFCFHGYNSGDKLYTLTRDTFGIAMKATYGETTDEKFYIYKDPVTDTNHLKKSHKGCCKVDGVSGNYRVTDQYMELVDEHWTALKTVFVDGKLVKEYTFQEIRDNLRGEN